MYLVDKMASVAYTLQMPTIKRTDEFSNWLRDLRDIRAERRCCQDRSSQPGNPGDIAPVGDGVSEMRIHYGPGYRVYYIQRGEEIVVLLCGGDKGSQASDIKTAKKLASELED
jgi:putative addiction module killer protein